MEERLTGEVTDLLQSRLAPKGRAAQRHEFVRYQPIDLEPRPVAVAQANGAIDILPLEIHRFDRVVRRTSVSLFSAWNEDSRGISHLTAKVV